MNRQLRAVAVIALAGLGIALGAALGGPSRAEAHGVQVSSNPAPNQQLAAAPGSVSVTFSEPVEPSVTTVQVWTTQPAEVPVSAPSFTGGDTVTVTLQDELPMGIYTVIWRNLSTVDGHSWAGSYTFTVLGPNGEAPQGTVPQSLQDLAQAPSQNPSTLESAARWIVLLGSAVMLGGAMYVLAVVLPSARLLSDDARANLRKLSTDVLVVTSLIAVFLVLQGSLIQLLVHADRLGGAGKADEILTDTRLGNYLIARQVLLIASLAAIGLVWRAKANILAPIGLLLLAALGVLVTQSMVSHAAETDGSFWKIGADLLHLLTASLWVGGVIHIGLSMPRWLDELRGVPRTLFAAESFRRFSVLAAFSVAVLLVSGVLSALAQFTSFEQLWETTYGRSLLGKMGAMLPLLAVAALNAFILQPRVVATGLQLRGASVDDRAADAPSAGLQRLLLNTVRIEAVLGIAVLCAVAVLIQLQPARAAGTVLQDTSSQPPPTTNEEGYYQQAAQIGGLIVSLRIDPATVGENTFEVGLGSEFGDIGEIQLVRLTFDHADPAIGASELELPLAGSAKFEAAGTNMSIPGDWTVTTTVRRRGEDDVRTDFTVPVASEAPGDGTAAAGHDESIWDWPFDGARSGGAIGALAAGGVALAAIAAWQYRSNVRRGAKRP